MSALRVSTYSPLICWASAEVASKQMAAIAAVAKTLRITNSYVQFYRCFAPAARRRSMLRLYLKYSGGPAMAFWLLFTAAAMAAPVTGAAVIRLRHLTIRPHTGLGDPAPEQAGVAGRHRGIR